MAHNAQVHQGPPHRRRQVSGGERRQTGTTPGSGKTWTERQTAAGDVPYPPTPSRAEREDEEMRKRWLGGRKLRSPYWSLLEMPASVAPGDHAGALAILARIEAVLAIKSGRWTKSERRRLRKMREAWEQRAAGENAAFNMCGWSGGGAAGKWWAAQDPSAKKVSRTIADIRRMVNGKQ